MKHQPKAAGGRIRPGGGPAGKGSAPCPIGRAAWRCVEIIEPLLQRPEEAGEAYREFFAAIAEELAAQGGQP